MRKPSDVQEGRPLYIIDGYNVILNRKAFLRGKSLEESRNYFIRLLDSYASRKKVEITVVWDGTGAPVNGIKGAARVKNIYSTSNRNADEKIVRMVERMNNRKRITVVSNDRKHIVGIVKSLGAHSMTAGEFLSLTGFHRIKGKRGPYNRDTYNRDAGKKEGGMYNSQYDAFEEKSGANNLSVDEWLKLFQSKNK